MSRRRASPPCGCGRSPRSRYRRAKALHAAWDAFQALCVALSLDVHMNAELLKQQQGTMSGGSTTPMSQSEGGRSADVA